MIPKIIHYCWFGGNPLPSEALMCIASWKRFFPDYQIKEWNESNFDVRAIPYIQQAYDAKKYAFVSDYARFWILYHEGGLYFDTDVEVIKPMDSIIAQGAFMGCETSPTPSCPEITVNPGLCLGVEKGHPLYKALLDLYATLTFQIPDGSPSYKTVVGITTEFLEQHGLQTSSSIQNIEGINIYPKEYFCPISISGDTQITDHTYSIHHYAQSWRPTSHRVIRALILKIGGPKLKQLASKVYAVIKK